MPGRWPRRSGPGTGATEHATVLSPGASALGTSCCAHQPSPTATAPSPALSPSYPSPSPLSLLPVLTLCLPDSNRRKCGFHLGFGLEFKSADLSPFEKGQQFAYKLITQWLDVAEGDDDLILLDGAGDGGIDIAYLQRPDLDEGEQEESPEEGHTWYLVQSKYGSSFKGYATIVSEGQKAISTISGDNRRISHQTRQFVERISNFRKSASVLDRMILVFATDMPIPEADRRALEAVRSFGIDQFGTIFDVEAMSLSTIWENRPPDDLSTMRLTIKGSFAETDLESGLRIGAIPLTDLYDFLKEYDMRSGNLDQLYEKNVRQFLGGRKKINKGIANTLRENPENFGLYNNGITIVASELTSEPEQLVLRDPYVVNGCQTTKTIWAVLRERLDSGGTGGNSQNDEWQERARKGVVLAKIVKSDHAQISNITRYTNSQNAVREQDFLTLENEFQSWSSAMVDRYGIFLEIQRGGWDARRAYQKRYLSSSHQFKEFANAFELIKVYGAGWLRWPGQAFGRSTPFLPGGFVFKHVTETEKIGVDDLFAAYRLQKSAEEFNFGRGFAVLPSRRLTRYLYYFVVLELLRDVLIRGNISHSGSNMTKAFLELQEDEHYEALQLLLNGAIEVVDEYLNDASEDSVFKEAHFAGNLNGWLKSERLGRNEEGTYRLNTLLATHKAIFGRAGGGYPSPRSLVINSIGNAQFS